MPPISVPLNYLYGAFHAIGYVQLIPHALPSVKTTTGEIEALSGALQWLWRSSSGLPHRRSP
jgi:hypothetical protein